MWCRKQTSAHVFCECEALATHILIWVPFSLTLRMSEVEFVVSPVYYTAVLRVLKPKVNYVWASHINLPSSSEGTPYGRSL